MASSSFPDDHPTPPKTVQSAARLRPEAAEEVGEVVVEHGTVPLDDLYFELKERASNRGEVDLDALIAGEPQVLTANPDGRDRLFRIGDAVASRNIHAAILHAISLCKAF